MSWSYSGNPASSDLDAVRFLIGDTNTADQQLSNEEIQFLIDQEGNVYRAAAKACLSISAKFARFVDKSVGDLQISYSQRQAAYASLAQSLTNQAATRSAIPYAGGISLADKHATEDNTDRTPPAFYRGQFTEPGANTDSGRSVNNPN